MTDSLLRGSLDFGPEESQRLDMAYLPEVLDAFALAEDVQGLMEYWATIDAAQDRLGAWKWMVEKRIRAAMEDTRAEVAESTGASATYRGAAEVDRNALQALKEHMGAEEWDALLTAQRPAPERSLNMTKVKALIKKGDPFRGIIEGATGTGPPRLKLARKDDPE